MVRLFKKIKTVSPYAKNWYFNLDQLVQISNKINTKIFPCMVEIYDEKESRYNISKIRTNGNASLMNDSIEKLNRKRSMHQIAMETLSENLIQAYRKPRDAKIENHFSNNRTYCDANKLSLEKVQREYDESADKIKELFPPRLRLILLRGEDEIKSKLTPDEEKELNKELDVPEDEIFDVHTRPLSPDSYVREIMQIKTRYDGLYPNSSLYATPFPVDENQISVYHPHCLEQHSTERTIVSKLVEDQKAYDTLIEFKEEELMILDDENQYLEDLIEQFENKIEEHESLYKLTMEDLEKQNELNSKQKLVNLERDKQLKEEYLQLQKQIQDYSSEIQEFENTLERKTVLHRLQLEAITKKYENHEQIEKDGELLQSVELLKNLEKSTFERVSETEKVLKVTEQEIHGKNEDLESLKIEIWELYNALKTIKFKEKKPKPKPSVRIKSTSRVPLHLPKIRESKQNQTQNHHVPSYFGESKQNQTLKTLLPRKDHPFSTSGVGPKQSSRPMRGVGPKQSSNQTKNLLAETHLTM